MKPQPPASSGYVHPDRLIEAADAILYAEAGKRGNRTVTMWTDPKTAPKEGFSSTELIEAYMFLGRLGLVEGRE